MSKKLMLAAAVFTMLLELALTAPTIMAAPAARPLAACSSRMWLRPHAEYVANPFTAQHRNWLEPTAPYNGSGYIILNTRTYEAHYPNEWKFWNGRFYVSTFYAFTHPQWGADPWVLLYNC